RVFEADQQGRHAVADGGDRVGAGAAAGEVGVVVFEVELSDVAEVLADAAADEEAEVADGNRARGAGTDAFGDARIPVVAEARAYVPRVVVRERRGEQQADVHATVLHVREADGRAFIHAGGELAEAEAELDLLTKEVGAEGERAAARHRTSR